MTYVTTRIEYDLLGNWTWIPYGAWGQTVCVRTFSWSFPNSTERVFGKLFCRLHITLNLKSFIFKTRFFTLQTLGKKILLGIYSRGILQRMFSCDRIFHREYIHLCNAFKLFVALSEFAALHWNKTFHNFSRIIWKHITVQWRNGWFADLSEAAKASNQPDPSPYHTAIMGPLYVKVTYKYCYCCCHCSCYFKFYHWISISIVCGMDTNDYPSSYLELHIFCCIGVILEAIPEA